MTIEERRQLDEQGFIVLENCMGVDLLRQLREQIHDISEVEGDRAGHEFRTEAHARRLANLVDKGEVFRRAIVLPPVVECVRHVLGPQVKLSSLNARSADPNGDVPQPLHVDMSALRDEHGYWVCNTIWMLDDFTTERQRDESHSGLTQMGRRPQGRARDPCAASEEVLVLGSASSIAVMNAHAWHGGTANRTAAPRLAMHAFYCRRDKPQQQYQEQVLRPDVQDSLSPELREMLALDDPLNDALSAKVSTRSSFM